MKLFSAPGKHTPVVIKKPKVLFRVDGLDIYLKDILTITSITVGMLIIGVLIFTAPPIEVRATEPVLEQTVESEPVEQTVEPTVAPIKETLALAIGIDAVISSVPDGKYATDVTMVMVGEVILNRTLDSRFPSTVEEVLTQPMQFSSFSETGLKWLGVASHDEAFKERCINAAERVLTGERILPMNVVYVSSSRQGSVLAQLDGLYFCR